MNDMLQHQEYLSHEIERHQAESRKWAQAGMLGRLADNVHERAHRHPRGTRLALVGTPTALALGLLAIII